MYLSPQDPKKKPTQTPSNLHPEQSNNPDAPEPNQSRQQNAGLLGANTANSNLQKQDIADNEPESRKRERGDWLPDASEVQQKVFINNKRKEKVMEVDSVYEGIFLYKPGMELPSLFHYANQSIKVIIAAEYIKKTNPQVLKRNIYGSETYTSNSDCVCIAVHSGFVTFNNFQNNKKYQGIQIVFKVIKPKKNYVGTTKNGITSRTIKGYNGNALKPETYKMLTSLGTIQNLEKYASNMHIPIGKSRLRIKPRNMSSIIPIPETHIVFNMNNQPAYKYSILNLADKGLQKNQFIRKKLDSQVLYLQTQKNQKFQLAKTPQAVTPQNQALQTFRFSRIKNPYLFDNNYFEQGHVPLDNKDLQIVNASLLWDEIQWGNQTIKVKDFFFRGLTSFKYYKRSGK